MDKDRFTKLSRYKCLGWSVLIVCLSQGLLQNFALAGGNTTEEAAATPVEATEEPPPPPPDREKEISEKIANLPDIGEVVWLGDQSNPFLALYQENREGDTKGGIIILHELGYHLNAAEVIDPMRNTLPDHGWSTLSLQLPMAETRANKQDYLQNFDQAVERVKTGIEFFKQKNILNIIIAGHGMGAAIGIYSLTQQPVPDISAFVGISIPAERKINFVKEEEPSEEVVAEAAPAEQATQAEKKEKTEPEKQVAEQAPAEQAVVPEIPERKLREEFAKLTLPVLDIFGAQDRKDVLGEADQRLKIAKKSKNQGYRQLPIKGADHFFRGHEALLIKRIRGWLEKNALGAQINL